MPRMMLFLLLAFLIIGGCAGDKGKELFETAQFEEKQQNREHAVQLYAEVIRRFPDSDFAGKAKQRLAVIAPR